MFEYILQRSVKGGTWEHVTEGHTESIDRIVAAAQKFVNPVYNFRILERMPFTDIRDVQAAMQDSCKDLFVSYSEYRQPVRAVKYYRVHNCTLHPAAMDPLAGFKLADLQAEWEDFIYTIEGDPVIKPHALTVFKEATLSRFRRSSLFNLKALFELTATLKTFEALVLSNKEGRDPE